MTTRLVLLLAPGLLLCVCASVSSAGTSVPFRGEFKRDIETTFLAQAGPPPVVSRQKVSAYRDYLTRKLRFLKDHIERHDIVDEGKSRKAAREEARTADITIALEHALELLEILEQTDSARDPGEIYDLGDQAAQDLGRYDFFKDIERLERFVRSGESRSGAAIFLTNDSAYWGPTPNREVAYENFAMTNERRVSGELTWGSRASSGTRRSREAPISLKGSYALRWQAYSELDLDDESYTSFGYLYVEVPAPS